MHGCIYVFGVSGMESSICDNGMLGIQMIGKSLKTTNSTFYFKAS